MSAFLAEAAALVARRPGELFELTESLLSNALAAHGPSPSGPSCLPAGGPGQGSDAGLGLGFSLLAQAALRQAVRVAGSGKMAANARAGIAAYVAGAPAMKPTSTLMLLSVNPNAPRKPISVQESAACMSQLWVCHD